MTENNAMDFLRALLRTVKPERVVAAGISAASAGVVEETLRANGCGNLLRLMDGSAPRGRIDLFLCAAGEERRLRETLPQVSEHGLILLHDREAALAMEREGLLSAVLLSTAHPFALAQKSRQRG
jgi:hypothetical protein